MIPLSSQFSIPKTCKRISRIFTTLFIFFLIQLYLYSSEYTLGSCFIFFVIFLAFATNLHKNHEFQKNLLFLKFIFFSLFSSVFRFLSGDIIYFPFIYPNFKLIIFFNTNNFKNSCINLWSINISLILFINKTYYQLICESN